MVKATPAPTTTPSTLAANAPGIVAHTHVRMRGTQTGDIAVYAARTPKARVTLTVGTVLMTFWSAAAVQGVLEGISAAKATLLYLPAAMPITADPYGQLTVAVDWTSRPSYAVIPQTRVSDDKRITLRWTDIHMGPMTWQLLDRAAFHSLTELLREAHRTAIAVCLDGPQHRADPTADDYKPTQTPQ
ncbi:MAG: hypothetical protein AB7G47_19950 [Mycolicibacterium sp.]|uniref:hypothetical protein n=1 Tax=Mycolicibacterium sp. TaxID=2320850 RepID=UPI003D0D8F41